MTPKRVKAIRHALRRSDGRKPTQKQLSAFLRMGECSVHRYEAGMSIPCTSNALMLEMLTDRRTVERIGRLNKSEGIFSDIRLSERCWECEGYNTALEVVDQKERGRGNVPPFTYPRGKVVCQDCGAAWYPKEWRESLAMSGFKAALSKKNPASVLMAAHVNRKDV